MPRAPVKAGCRPLAEALWKYHRVSEQKPYARPVAAG